MESALDGLDDLRCWLCFSLQHSFRKLDRSRSQCSAIRFIDSKRKRIFQFQSIMGDMITQKEGSALRGFRSQAAFSRRLSICFSQEMMRFQLGMLWDATLYFLRANVLLRILAETLERTHRFEFWLVSDLLPIFLANIFIDLNYVRIKRIKAVLLTA